MKRVLAFFTRYFALLAVGGAFILSAIGVARQRLIEDVPGVITLRIGHWQLEAGVREALDLMADDYRKLHPNVRIIQEAIPETTYGQWLTTQLMGSSPPDIVQVGNGRILPPQVWLTYYTRYFLPVTGTVSTPNPYNATNELVRLPLRATYKDGLRSAYIEETQDYMSIPLSQHSVRIFYNRDLLKKLTGRDEAPVEYRDFLAVCEKIRQQKDAEGHPYVAIAGSSAHTWMWENALLDPLTYGAVPVADYSRDGKVGNDESFMAFRLGALSLASPPYAARFKMLGELSPNFQNGYTGLTRDDALFLFAQNRAVFIAAGTWDGGGLRQQAEGNFNLGIVDFPSVRSDDPEFGKTALGPRYEFQSSTFSFSITRSCAHPEVALDFLLFMAGKQQNEKLNSVIGWIPAIKGARVNPDLAAFEPNLEGVYSAFNVSLGGNTAVRWTQLSALYQVGQISFDELTAQFEPYYKNEGLKDFAEQQRDWHRGTLRNEQLLAGMRARAMNATTPAASDLAWRKYRAVTRGKQIGPLIWRDQQALWIANGRLPNGYPGPYQYRPAALAAIASRAAR